MTKQEMLAEVSSRFAAARAELAKIVAEFPKERGYQQEAQWDMANSFLTEARAVGAVSPTLARGQFVRAARELRAVADKYPNHPRIGAIPADALEHLAGVGEPRLRRRGDRRVERAGDPRSAQPAGPAGGAEDRPDLPARS